METRAPEERIVKLRRSLKYNHHFAVNANGQSGGLGLLRNNKVDIEVKEASQNFIHTEGKVKEGRKD